jgi:hypothetical protein
MSDTQQRDWTKPAAMAIPNGGVFEGKMQQGRYRRRDDVRFWPKGHICSDMVDVRFWP